MVTSLLKPDCPCNDPRCKAVGVPLKSTGHSKGCFLGCPTCSRPKGQPKRKRIPEQVRRAVRARSGEQCEFASGGVRCEEMAVHMHHRRRRSQGGRDTVSNLVDLCSSCHSWTHEHPEAAAALGLLELREPPTSAVTKVERA